MYVYKSTYDCKSSPIYYNREIIIPNTKEVLKFAIYVIPRTESLYDILTINDKFSNLSMANDDCFIYITTNEKFSIEIMEQIEKYIKDNISETEPAAANVKIDPTRYIPSVKQAILMYKNITLFFPMHTNNKFIYDNYSNRYNNTISIHDSKIHYKFLTDRHDFSKLCGKVTRNNEVILFDMYPIANTNIVYILPPEFTILIGTNNKVATLMHDNFVFWIITTHTFVNYSPQSQEFASTKFCPKSENIETINNLLTIFRKYKFSSFKFMNSSISSEDSKNSIMMFVGIYDMQYLNKYTKHLNLLIPN
ncbi:hypothetical protein CsNV_041 [Callinectes sapidus nudivirus]|nr:hypothetical protein CsNV_041 [Callinectes sapidus nudivirus]